MSLVILWRREAETPSYRDGINGGKKSLTHILKRDKYHLHIINDG
jgi:hypothetical protein